MTHSDSPYTGTFTNSSGTIHRYVNGKLHSTTRPAVENDLSQEYYFQGLRHNIQGAAIDYSLHAWMNAYCVLGNSIRSDSVVILVILTPEAA